MLRMYEKFLSGRFEFFFRLGRFPFFISSLYTCHSCRFHFLLIFTLLPLSFVYPDYYFLLFNPVHSLSVSVGSMASSTFFTSKSDWAVLLASHLVSRVHSCYTGFLFFLNSVGLWVFGFLFYQDFWGKVLVLRYHFYFYFL